MTTEAQLQALETARIERLSRCIKCPKCKSSKVYVVDTRRSPSAHRRRRKCSSCGWAATTYEIDASHYQRLLDIEKRMQSLRPSLQSLIGSIAETIAETTEAMPPETQSSCDTCKFNDTSKCSHSLPEFQSEDSHDCIYFEAA